MSALAAIGAAMTPVMFSYGGWQTSSFVAGEMKEPRRDLARGLLLGVAGVVLLYTAVAFVCVHALGPQQLGASKTPATDLMRLALGGKGATFIAIGITISTLGFLSQGMLTAPRVYFAMAEDGLFFRSVARVSARTHVPVIAIVLQGVAGIPRLNQPDGIHPTAEGQRIIARLVADALQPLLEPAAKGVAGAPAKR